MTKPNKRIVTVLDCNNLKPEYREKCPFSGELTRVARYPSYRVTSIETGKAYELHWHQIKEIKEEHEKTTRDGTV